MPAGLQECPGIFVSGCLVQVDRQEPAGFIEEHGIEADRKVTSRPLSRIYSQEMVSYHVVCHRQQVTMRAIIASTPRLVADPAGPFVATGWLIALLAGLQALESPGVYVIPAPKQTSEEGDSRFLGRLIGHQCRLGLQRGCFLPGEEGCLLVLQFADVHEQFSPARIQIRQLLFGFSQQSVDLIQASHCRLDYSVAMCGPALSLQCTASWAGSVTRTGRKEGTDVGTKRPSV